MDGRTKVPAVPLEMLPPSPKATEDLGTGQQERLRSVRASSQETTRRGLVGQEAGECSRNQQFCLTTTRGQPEGWARKGHWVVPGLMARPVVLGVFTATALWVCGLEPDTLEL